MPRNILFPALFFLFFILFKITIHRFQLFMDGCCKAFFGNRIFRITVSIHIFPHGFQFG